MNYTLRPSRVFLKQIDKLSASSKRILKRKLELTKENPFRNKRVKGHGLFLFRIRLEDNHKEKRVIYLVEKSSVKLVCILDRDKEYKDLKQYLKPTNNLK